MTGNYDALRADDPAWFTEGFVSAARAERGSKLHAGVVHPLGARFLSMSPLCLRYRKRDGARLRPHEDGRYPMLVGCLRRAFGDYVTGVRPHGLPLCRHCVAVWRADQEAVTT